MPVGRISHWHLLCSKNTGESHLESSQCLRITLGIFSKFLRPKEIAAPEQRGRPGQRIQAKGDAG